MLPMVSMLPKLGDCSRSVGRANAGVVKSEGLRQGLSIGGKSSRTMTEVSGCASSLRLVRGDVRWHIGDQSSEMTTGSRPQAPGPG
jgi:hypothetical protein